MSAYSELANQIEEHLLSLHPYFGRLANAMRGWVKTWRATTTGAITFTPSRSHKSSAIPINLTSRSKEKAPAESAIGSQSQTELTESGGAPIERRPLDSVHGDDASPSAARNVHSIGAVRPSPSEIREEIHHPRWDRVASLSPAG